MNNIREKLERVNLVLNTLRHVNQMLAKEKDRDRMLKGICDKLIENQGYFNAWIALLDRSGKLLQVFDSGLGNKLAPMITLLKAGRLTECGRKALGQPDIVLTEDPHSFCTECPLSRYYAGRGAITVRLEHEGVIYGFLTLSIPRHLVLDKEEQDLITEIAGDIAFGLYNLEAGEKQKQTEEKLAESETRFRALVENSLIGIFIVQQNNIVYSNPEQLRLFNPMHKSFAPPDFAGIHPDDLNRFKKAYSGLMSGGFKTLEMDFRFFPSEKMDRDNHMKWISSRAIVIDYRGSKAILFNMMDMTKARKLEQLLTIQDKMASLGRVAAGIAHEIRNPLSGINIYVNTLAKMCDDSRDRDTIKQILAQLQSASNKIESVIRRVMDFSKPAAPRFALIDINKPIEDSINLSSVSLRKTGVQMEMNLGEKLPLCHADPHLIEEVILNLLSNASEAMKNRSDTKKIEVASSAEGGRILITVSDSGPGVGPDLREKIFDPFYTTKNDGTGIGLSLCRRILTDHRGSLGVFDSKLGGAEFRIEIPIHQQQPTRIE